MTRPTLRQAYAGLTLTLSLIAATPVSANTSNVDVAGKISASVGYSNLYVFGDSLSDSGNLFAATGGFPPAPNWNGRFSNGPTYAEDLAGMLGLSANSIYPLGSGGTNYAYGGATAGPTLSPPNLTTQVNMFRSLPGAADANALYVVWAGANDMRSITSPAMIDTAMAGAQAGISSAINGLYAEGARNFLVMNLPDLGLTPESKLAGLSTEASFVSGMFNTLFDVNMAGLRSTLAGSHILTLDTYSLLHSVVANHGAYGVTLSNVTDACLLAGPACNPNDYLFWDKIHPTAAAHSLIAQAAYNVVAVPEPETYALMLMGLGLLGLVARHRKQHAA